MLTPESKTRLSQKFIKKRTSEQLRWSSKKNIYIFDIFSEFAKLFGDSVNYENLPQTS